MTMTTPRPPRRRHLAAVPDTARQTGAPAPAAVGRPVLQVLARLDVEQARKFLIELDAAAASTSPLLARFLLGRCAEHAQALLDVIDAAMTL